MRRANSITSRPRARSRSHPARRGSQRTGTARPILAEVRARRIAKLLAREHQLLGALATVREQRDGELLAARRDKIPHAIVGHAIQVANGSPQTADELARIESLLRKKTHDAIRRRRVTRRNEARVAVGPRETHDRSQTSTENDAMREPILKRRTTIEEEWIVPREAVEAEDKPDVEDLNHDVVDDDLDDDLDDDADADADEDGEDDEE